MRAHGQLGMRMVWFRVVPALILAMVIGLPASGQCDYEVTAIIEGPICSGETSPSSFGATSIAENSDVAGVFVCFINAQAATWDDVNGFASLPFLSGFSVASVSDLNSIDEVVGSLFSSATNWRAVVWRTGQPSLLAEWPGSDISFASDINRDGWIVGCHGSCVPDPRYSLLLR